MTPLTELTAEVLTLGREAGLDAVGVAAAEPFDDARRALEDRRAAGLHGGMHFTYGNPARSTDPAAALPGAAALVVGARRHRTDEPPPPPVAGRVARYAWSDEYAPLRAALDVVAERLRGDGHRARVLVDDNALVDRAAAQRAGLGWYGKNANLLLPGQGSWFLLGSVVTTAALVPSDESVPDGCGTCRRCLDGCPTGAIVAPGVVDARRCLAWLLQDTGPFPRDLRQALGDRIYGCDDCQEVCPPNHRARRAGMTLGARDDDQPWVDLVAMLRSSDEELMAEHGRWYIPRRDPAYLRRNALVVLGNVGDGADPAVAEVVADALADPRPVVRSHAVWAAAALGRQDLLTALEPGQPPEVLDELDAAGADR